MPYLLEGAFQKLDRDIDFLSDCLRDMLAGVDADASALQAYIPRRSELPAPPARPAVARRAVQVLSLWFHLLNMVEENTAMMTRRRRETNQGCTGEPGLWGAVLAELLEHGFDARSILAGLRRHVVEPVLTAHPTEAKRPEVLRMYRELYLRLFELENSTWTALERETIRRRIVAMLERIWRSGEVAFARPTVRDEFDNVCHYFSNVFPGVLPFLDDHFRHAWRHLGLDGGLLSGPTNWPRLRFGNWVGGDRDGHALVNADVTRHVLRALRRGGLRVLHGALEQMAVGLRLSRRIQEAPEELLEAIHDLAVEQDVSFPTGQKLDEPWHTYADLLVRRVRAEIDSLEAGAQGTLAPSDLASCLDTLGASLEAIGARRIADDCVLPARRLLDVFGLHLADLDIRQNSAYHDRAVIQLLRARGLDDPHFDRWSEDRRRAFLLEELQRGEPWRLSRAALGEEAGSTLDVYRVLSGHLRLYGRDGLGGLIVSMTRTVSDLLSVVLLGREAGLARRVDGWWTLPLPVVPLFETQEDLRGAPDVLRSALDLPPLRVGLQALEPRWSEPEGSESAQVVMIGYSDSNKDAGFLTSQWTLHQAQRAMAEAGREKGIAITFFHGRGGTVSRGAGPTHRFLEALPLGTLHGPMLLTEQGETVAQKYANLGTATYNLELLQAGALHVGLLHQKGEDPPAGVAGAVEVVAARSARHYRDILQREGFLSYWSEATPIDVLERGVIGSRPVRRTGERSLDDLRAIPWVFSWLQSRHYLTGWYGAGAALLGVREESPKDFDRLKAALESWSFWRYCVYNLQTSWASVDPDLVRRYAELVGDASIQKTFVDAILDEFERTGEAIRLLAGDDWLGRRPRMTRTLELRAAGLRVLHLRQIALLRDWRGTVSAERPDGDPELLRDLQLTVNALSSGLRAVG